MHTHLLTFFLVYLLFFFHGLWLYLLLFPKRNDGHLALFCLTPILGVCALSLYGNNLIWFSKPLPEFNIALFVLAAVLDAIALWFHRAWLTEAVGKISRSRVFSKDAYINAFFVIASPLALLAPIHGVPLTIQWRIGPDAGGYINSASFLVQGQTLDSFSGKFLVPNEIYAYEFMVQALRRGCIAIIAIVSDALGRIPAESAFLVTAVQLFLLQLAVVWAVRTFFRVSLLTGWLISAAVILNCNLLSIFLEGGYAQISSMSLIAVIVFLSQSTELEDQSVLRKGALYGLLFSGAAALYLESLFVILPLLAGYAVVNFLVDRSAVKPKDYLTPLVALVVAVVTNWDVLIHWIPFQIDNSNLLSIAGWPQPQWASLPEIMGWIDIYTHVVGNNWDVHNHPGFWQVLASTLITLYVLYLFLSKLRKKEMPALLASVPFLLTIASYIYFKEVRHVHNYSYMKIYTLIMPFFVAGTLLLFSSYRAGANSRESFISALLSVVVIINGALYIKSYMADYAYLDAGAIELAAAEKTVDLDKYVMLSKPDIDKYAGLRELFLRSIMKAKMIHTGFFPQQDFSQEANSDVALIVHGRLSGCANLKKDILWEGRGYTILNTHMPVIDAWKDKSKIDWKPSAKFIPRPEIEIRWNRKNIEDNATRYFDFAPYYAKATCGG